MKSKYTEEHLKWIEENFSNHLYSYDEMAEMFSSLFFPLSKDGIRKIVKRNGLTEKYGTMTNLHHHTAEEINFVKALYEEKVDLKEIARLYSEKFHHLTTGALRHMLRDNNISPKSTKYLPFTDEQEQWLLDNWKNYSSWSQVAKEFTKRFRPVSADTLTHRMRKKYGIVYEQNKRFSIENRYSVEEKKFITENINVLPYQKFIVAFKERFSRNLTHSALDSFLKRYGIKRSKEIISKTKAIATSNRLNAGIGSERLASDGNVYVKITDFPNKNNWKMKKVIEWERLNNKQLPKGWRVVQLDRDAYNFDKDNLFAAPYEGVVASLGVATAHNPAIKKCDAEWTKTYLMTCQLRAEIEKKFGIILNRPFNTGYKILRKGYKLYSVIDDKFNLLVDNVSYKEAHNVASGKQKEAIV